MSPNRMCRMRAIVSMLALVAACSNGGELQADAGADFSIKVGESPTFDGCDSQGEIQNYGWVIVEAPDVMAGDTGKVIREIDPSCSFTLGAAMEIQEVGQWVVELTVSDESGNVSNDTVTVDISN